MTEYPKPSVTADVILFTVRHGSLQVLLIERAHDPFAGHWALPGGFVDAGEDLATAARRELLEETGLEVGRIEQLQAVGTPGRDPRGWTITVVYFTVVDAARIAPRAGDDAKHADWFALDELPDMAFDHREILESARSDLRRQLIHSPLSRQLAPEEFTIAQFASNLSTALGTEISEPDLRRALSEQGAIESTSPDGPQYRFVEDWNGTLCSLLRSHD